MKNENNKNDMSRKSFVAYRDWQSIFEMLNDEELGRLTRVIFDYVNGKKVEIDDRVLKIVFENIRLTIDRDTQKYNAIVQRNKENGKKGGRPKKENPKNPLGYLATQNNPPEPKKADSDSDSDIDIDIDNISIERDWKKSFELYQEYVRQGYNDVTSDKEWINKQQEYNPGVDITKSIEKSCVNFWSTHEGWANKKKNKAKTINWKTTFGNAISNSINKVYLNKENENEKRKYHQF